MIELTLEQIKPDYFIMRGDKVTSIVSALSHHSPNTRIKIVGLDKSYDNIIESMKELPNDTLVYAIGNQVGAGQDILESISSYRYNG